MPEAVQPLPPFWLQLMLGFANETGRLGYDGLLSPEDFYPTFEAWRTTDPLGFTQSQGNFGFDSAGLIVYAELPVFVHGVQNPAPCISFVGELQNICDEATERGLPSYALGLPFYRCERYVHLRYWCLRGVAIALAVVFGVSVLFMGALREATLMTLTLLLNITQLSGCLAFAGMKINGALVMATVASIGCASEYAGHFTIAFLQAHGSRADRLDFAYARSLHPLFDSACSTVLGIAMIAFAAFPFVVKYFFVPMVVLTGLNFANAVLLLPALLMVLGADNHGGEEGDATKLASTPAYTPRPSTKSEPTTPEPRWGRSGENKGGDEADASRSSVARTPTRSPDAMADRPAPFLLFRMDDDDAVAMKML